MDVVHDQTKHEFTLQPDPNTGSKAYLSYELKGDTIDFQHTVVPPEYRGQGIAEKLVRSALTYVENEQSIKKITPSCSYVAKFLSNAPQYAHYLNK